MGSIIERDWRSLGTTQVFLLPRVVWKFSLQGAPVLTNMKRELPQLTVSDPYTKATFELEYLNPYSTHKTLGHYKEPAGTLISQFKHLKEKSDSITDFCGQLLSPGLKRGRTTRHAISPVFGMNVYVALLLLMLFKR